MASKTDHLPEDCEYFLGRCSHLQFDHQICRRCSSANISNADYQSVAERLKNLPKVKANNSFDQKMAAAFAMELQKETMQRNRSWLKKHPQISLPDISTDLIKNLF